MTENSQKHPLYIRLTCALIILIALGYLLILGREMLTPLAFALLLSILLLPLAELFEYKLRIPRGAAAGLTIICFIALIVIIFIILGGQISGLASDWPNFKKQLLVSYSEVQLWVFHTFHINASKQLSYINSALDSLLNTSTFVIGTTLLSISSVVFTLIFVFLYTLFLLIYRSLLKRFLIRLFREENSPMVFEIIEKTQKMIRKYITGLIIEMVIVASVVSIAFWAMGIKYAFLLGLLTGIFNLIPYIGIFTALFISVLITFATATGIKVLLVVITIIAVHLIDANVLLPVIVGSKVKINALITVMGVVIGAMFWSIPGMFLSIPILAILKIIFDRVESLQVWGLLLGEDEKEKGKLNT